MGAYSIAEAKAQLSALIEKVESGEAVTLTKRGIPVAKIVPLNSPAPRPKLDIERIRRFSASIPPSKISAVEAVRRMRDGIIDEADR